MSELFHPAADANPFSTRFVRPGAIPFHFAADQTAEQLVRSLADCGWRGQIIGPHGSGKSTLLAALAEPLAHAGRRVSATSLRDRARRMPKGWVRRAKRAEANLIVVDGYEQLSARGRIAVNVRCLWQGWGLLVTAHRDVGLPTLYVTSSRLDTLQAIVHRLLDGHDQQDAVAPQVVADCYEACDGDARETLFALYDRWEAGHMKRARID